MMIYQLCAAIGVVSLFPSQEVWAQQIILGTADSIGGSGIVSSTSTISGGDANSASTGGALFPVANAADAIPPVDVVSGTVPSGDINEGAPPDLPQDIGIGETVSENPIPDSTTVPSGGVSQAEASDNQPSSSAGGGVDPDLVGTFSLLSNVPSLGVDQSGGGSGFGSGQ